MSEKIYYSPSGKSLWDAWFMKRDNLWHVFHLFSEFREQSERDDSAAIGHAVSSDLINWQEQEPALAPGATGQWDDLALWTGSVVEKDNLYYMLYTGRNRAERIGPSTGAQRIGLATSKDLTAWQKHPNNPVLEADPKYYHMENDRNSLGTVQAWRDPFVFKDRQSGKYYALISARTAGQNQTYNACIAIAESRDLLDWKILPPLVAPARYEDMEVPQMVRHEGRWYLFFSTLAERYEPGYAKQVGAHSGLHCYLADELFGEYRPANNGGAVKGIDELIYAERLLDPQGDTYTAIGWLWGGANRGFIGKLSHPYKIRIDGDNVTVA